MITNIHILDPASVVFHIPHSSTHIPFIDGFVWEAVVPNLVYQTDWATERIFDVKGVARLVTPWSRLFCDVERLPDDLEPCFKQGRGFYYSHGFDGTVLRHIDETRKMYVHEHYYSVHHATLVRMVAEALEHTGHCHIIDGHSFGDVPYGTQCEAPLNPDICIGTDAYHTPTCVLDYAVSFFRNRGFSVEVDNPFAGFVVPQKYYRSNPNVTGLMIEVNKRLYMNGDSVINEQVELLKGVMQDYVAGYCNLTDISADK